jgi:NAD(P)-dependent dehydrogenase (short-subunit alcohol dehydrogenase family)
MAEIQQCLDEALNIWGRIDVLVNNAGSVMYGLSEELG